MKLKNVTEISIGRHSAELIKINRRQNKTTVQFRVINESGTNIVELSYGEILKLNQNNSYTIHRSTDTTVTFKVKK